MLTAANAVTLEASTFNILQPDGFFVPYGDYPHKNGLQKFDKPAAQAMAEHFNSLLSRIANAFAGPAVYIGHPDVPGRGAEFADKKAYGRITGIEPREDGCHFAAKMNKDGVDLIANSSFAYYSPYWGCEKIAGGIRPVQLFSIGLTNTPNIDVPALANDDEAGGQRSKIGDQNQTQEENDMNPQLIAALVAANIIAEGDAEDVILTKVAGVKLAAENDKGHDACVAAANEHLLELANQEASAEQKLTEVKSLIEAANTALTTARTAAVTQSLDLAITTGRLAEADREARSTALLAIENTADFAAALSTLVTADPVLKTTAATASLSADGKKITAANEDAGKSRDRQQLVENCKKKFPNLKGGALHDAAWNAARAASPALFA